MSNVTLGQGAEAKTVDMESVKKGFQKWSGYEETVKDGVEGNIVLGNSREHLAMVSSYNNAMVGKLEEFKKANPNMDEVYLQRLREKMELKVGDHISYTADKQGNMSTWKVERGGEVIQNFSAKDSAGDTKAVSQDRVEYKGGTRSDGVLTGAVEQFARNFGASEETAKHWGARVAAVQGMINDINPMVAGAKTAGDGLSNIKTGMKEPLSKYPHSVLPEEHVINIGRKAGYW